MAASGLFLFFLLLSFSLFFLPTFTRTLPLTPGWMAALFGVKLVCAMAYTYIFFQHNPYPSDTRGFFDQSRLTTAQIHNWSDFMANCFPSVRRWQDLFHYAFWNDLKQNSFVLILMGLNAVTGNNMYTDTLLYSLLTYAGWIPFIRLIKSLYPGYASWIYMLPLLFPSFLFWYSGLHSDGLIFALLGYISFDLYRAFREAPLARGKTLPLWVRLIVCCFLLGVFRMYLLVLYIPLLLSFWLVSRKNGRPLHGWLFLGSAFVLFILLGATEMANRQQLFWQLKSPAPRLAFPLDPTISSFARHFPVAILNAFFRPALWENAYRLYFPVALEMLFLWLLLCRAAVRRTQWSFYESAYLVFILFNWLLVGMIIPYMGALIRYRSLLLPFLVAMLLLPSLRTRKKL